MSGSAKQSPRVLEDKQVLSRSLLWRIQERYYQEKGIDAWRDGDIPSLASTNAYVARVYAEAILGWISDMRPVLDADEPVYVLELGSGSGRLGFLVLKALERLRPLVPEADGVRVRYVMTDVVSSTIAFWKAHGPLGSPVASGQLSFARWSPEEGPELTLEPTGAVLDPARLVNPPVVISNYVFDTLACDAFHVRDGRLFEAAVTVTAGNGLEGEPGIDDVAIRFDDREVALPYYGAEDLDAALAFYRDRLAEGSVLFPIGAARCLRRLLELGRGRLLLLAADKGESHLRSFEGTWDWTYATHSGCFSFMVNFHAIGLLFEERGGVALHSPDPRDGFRFSAFALAPDGAPLAATRRALERAHHSFGFADVLGFTDPFAGEKPSFDRVIAMIKACEYDPYVFSNYESILDDMVEKLDDEDVRALVWVMERVAENDYRLGDHLDLPFLLGRIYYRLDDCERALVCFQDSLETSGPHEATYYNIGLCRELDGDAAGALAMFARALELKPRYLDAAERMRKLRAKRGSER